MKTRIKSFSNNSFSKSLVYRIEKCKKRSMKSFFSVSLFSLSSTFHDLDKKIQNNLNLSEGNSSNNNSFPRKRKSNAYVSRSLTYWRNVTLFFISFSDCMRALQDCRRFILTGSHKVWAIGIILSKYKTLLWLFCFFSLSLSFDKQTRCGSLV